MQAASDLYNHDVRCELEEFCRNDDALHLQERLGSFSNGIWKPNTDLQAQYQRRWYKYYNYLVSLLCVATLLLFLNYPCTPAIDSLILVVVVLRSVFPKLTRTCPVAGPKGLTV